MVSRQKFFSKTFASKAILKNSKELEAVILFGDEVSFAQWGSLARTWAPRGQQPVVKTSGKRKGLKMYSRLKFLCTKTLTANGVIEFRNGDFEYMECEGRFNGEQYIKFLKQLLDKYSLPII